MPANPTHNIMAPKFVFFDSSMWIYLANGFKVFSGKYLDLHFKIFDILERRAAEGSLVILTNEIVKEEWERNEEESAKQLGYEISWMLLPE